MTYSDAIAEMFAVFKDIWDVKAVQILGYLPPVIWQGVQVPIDKSNYWASVTQRTFSETQSALNTARMFTAQGVLFIDIYCPRESPDARSNGRLLATAVKNAYKSPQTNTWFRNSTIQEQGLVNNAVKFTVVVQYEYDEEV